MKTKPSALGQNLQKMLKEMLDTCTDAPEKDGHAAQSYVFKNPRSEKKVAASKGSQPHPDSKPDHHQESCTVRVGGDTGATHQN
jgi:hypothetical protein